MQKCKFCQKDYDIKETKRIFGDVWWVGVYCTAQCYTKSMFTDTLEVSMKIERDLNLKIRVTDYDGGAINTQSVEANILYEILQELKRIRSLLPSRLDLIPEEEPKSSGGSISVDYVKGE